MTAYVDAAFCPHDDGKSQTGLVIMLGHCLICARSSKQKMNAKDSTEAELIALSDKTQDILWCCDFLQEQGYNMEAPTIHQDNMSTVHLVTKGGGNPRTRHLRARQYCTKELVDQKSIIVVYTRTNDMIADVMTKSLPAGQFNVMVRSMMHGGPTIAK